MYWKLYFCFISIIIKYKIVLPPCSCLCTIHCSCHLIHDMIWLPHPPNIVLDPIKGAQDCTCLTNFFTMIVSYCTGKWMPRVKIQLLTNHRLYAYKWISKSTRNIIHTNHIMIMISRIYKRKYDLLQGLCAFGDSFLIPEHNHLLYLFILSRWDHSTEVLALALVGKCSNPDHALLS